MHVWAQLGSGSHWPIALSSPFLMFGVCLCMINLISRSDHTKVGYKQDTLSLSCHQHYAGNCFKWYEQLLWKLPSNFESFQKYIWCLDPILNSCMKTMPRIEPTLLIPKSKLKAQMPTQMKGLHLGPNWGQSTFMIYYKSIYLYIYIISSMDRLFRCELHLKSQP